MSNRLAGYEAIEYVEAMLGKYDFAEGGAPTLSMYGNPLDPDGRDDLTPEQAGGVASEDPSLIYYDRGPA
jgi:hypothetical protein